MRYKKVQTKIQYNWFLNKASNNRRELVDGIISGKYLQVDETLLALNDEYVEAVIDENGKVVIKNWVYGEKYGYGGLCRNYN